MPRKNNNVSDSLDRITYQQAEYISQLFLTNPYKKILETGSGIGRLSHALSALGHDVTGLDKSEEYTLFARENRPGPNYVIGDIKALGGEKFDLIVSMYNSFGSCSTRNNLEDIIKEMTSLLLPSGGLLIQCGSMEWARRNYNTETSIIEFADGDIHTTKFFDWKQRKLTTQFNCNGFKHSCSLLFFEKREIEQELIYNGFSDIRIRDRLESNESSQCDHFFVFAQALKLDTPY